MSGYNRDALPKIIGWLSYADDDPRLAKKHIGDHERWMPIPSGCLSCTAVCRKVPESLSCLSQY